MDQAGRDTALAAAESLRNDPSSAQLAAALRSLATLDLNRPNAELLATFLVLVTKSIVDFGLDGDLQEDAKSVGFVAVFSSFVGLSALTSRLEQLGTKNPQPGQTARNGQTEPQLGSQRRVVLSLTRQVMQKPDLFASIYRANDSRDVVSLFCGSRLLSALAAAGSELDSNEQWTDGMTYSAWLAGQLGAFPSIPPQVLDRAFKLGYGSVISQTLIPAHFQVFEQAFTDLRSLQQIFVLRNVLTDLQDRASIPAIGAIWRSLQNSSKDQSLALSIASSSTPTFSITIQRASVLAVAPAALETATKRLLSTWGDRSTIATASLPVHRAQTQVLLLSVARMDIAAVQRLSATVEFVRGISNHLESATESIRKMGVLIGEAVSRRAGDKLRFEISQDDDSWVMGLDEDMSLELALEELQSASSAAAAATSTLQPVDELEGILTGEALQQDQDNEVAAMFDSDDEDEPEKVAPLVYVKDLLAYLRSDDFAKMNVAMESGAALIRRKAGFGTEVSLYANEILRSTAGLTDKFNIDGFATKRQSLLTATVVASPAEAARVSRLAVAGDYSLAQRTSLLSTLVLAAVDLAGATSGNGGAQASGVSQKLPQALHQAFATDVDALAFGIQDKLVRDTRDQFQETLGPQALRISRSLQAQRSREIDSSGNRQPNRYSAIAAKQFFFPLIGAWGNNAARMGGRDHGGDYAEVLHAHWIKTASLLVYYAYPTNDMGDMLREIVAIWMGYRSWRSVSIFEAIFTSILAIVDVSGALLAQQWPREVSLMAQWTGEVWQSVPSDSVQKLGAAAVLKLQELQAKIQEKFSAFAGSMPESESGFAGPPIRMV